MAGGGTAGHTSPLLATADALRRLDPGIEVIALGTPRGLEARVVPEAGYPLELVPPVPLPRRPAPTCSGSPAGCAPRCEAALEVVDRVRPDVVVGFGGYVSVPAYLAARRRHAAARRARGQRPARHREQARRPVHRRTSPPASPTPPLPARPLHRAADPPDDLHPRPAPRCRAEARASFGLDADLPTLLVTGGSQGARRLNQSVAAARPAFADAGVQVLHVAGPQGEADAAT